MSTRETFFAPQLLIPSGISDISFYLKAFGAVLIRQFLNDDGSIHVAELSVNSNIFHLHEERPEKDQLSPATAKGITCIIGLFVEDVNATVDKALQAGATLLNPVQDYDYGYRQALVRDVFGHHWLIESTIAGA